LTKIVLQTIPMGVDEVRAEVDMAALKAAADALDMEERRRQALIADSSRAKKTKAARAARRLKRALTLWRR
jgi:hypothetical protein